MEKEYRGNWYLPNSKDIKIPGILTIDRGEKRLILKLFSSFYFDGTNILQNPDSNKIINSIILGDVFRPFPNQQITLFSFDGFYTMKYEVTGELFEITYEADFLFIGKHFLDEDEIRFEEYWLQYNNLPAFIGHQNIFEHDWRNFQMQINRPNEFKIELENSCILEFVNEINSSLKSNEYYHAEAKHFVKFSKIDGDTFKNWRNLQSKIHSLLCLTVGGENSLINNFGVSQGGKIEIVSLKFDEIIEGNSSHKLFQLSDFKGDYVEEKIKKWFAIYDLFEPCISVFLFAVEPFWKKGSINIYHINFTNSMLNVSQAIESFYKKDNSIDYQEVKNQFSTKKNEIIAVLKKSNNCLSANDLKFVNNNLRLKGKNKNEVELVVIINHFLTANKESLSEIILEDKFSDFATELKNLRNTLTHINHESSDALPNNKIILFNIAQSLFVAILMNKIGFSQEEIKKMIKKLNWF